MKRANVGAGVAVNAYLFSPNNLVVGILGQGPCWTMLNTLTAMMTVVDCVRIVATLAMEITPLQEDHQAISRPINTGER